MCVCVCGGPFWSLALCSCVAHLPMLPIQPEESEHMLETTRTCASCFAFTFLFVFVFFVISSLCLFFLLLLLFVLSLFCFVLCFVVFLHIHNIRLILIRLLLVVVLLFALVSRLSLSLLRSNRACADAFFLPEGAGTPVLAFFFSCLSSFRQSCIAWLARCVAKACQRLEPEQQSREVQHSACARAHGAGQAFQRHATCGDDWGFPHPPASVMDLLRRFAWPRSFADRLGVISVPREGHRAHPGRIP